MLLQDYPRSHWLRQIAWALFSVPLAALAQTSDSQDDATLTTVTVEGRRLGEEVLPTRPVLSVYGTEAKVLDTPRSISTVSRKQLQDDPIKTFDDFVKYAPGLTRSTGQNVQGAPTMRAQSAEIFQNGQRIYSRQTDHPLNLNAVEAADIVSGPSSVVFGSGNNTGGYVNYTTKKPYFDKARTQISATAGSLLPGGESYTDLSWQLDHGGPISDELAYRFSYQQQRGSTYYDNVDNNYNAFYGALAWEPRDNLHIDWNIAYDDYYDYNETKGWNRTTQAQIDHFGSYYGGRATPLMLSAGAGIWSPVYQSGAPDSAVIGWQQRQANARNQYQAVGPVNSTPLPSANPATPGSVLGWVYDPTLPGNELTKLDASQGLANPRDKFEAKVFNTQLQIAVDISPDLTLSNSSYFQRSTNIKDTLQSYWVDTKDTLFEDRLELRWRTGFKLFGLSVEDDSNSGVSLRYEENRVKASLFNFMVSPYDLTQPAATQTPAQLYGGAWPVTGGGVRSSPYFGYLSNLPIYPVAGGLYSSPGGANYPALGAVADSQWMAYGLFTQHNLKFNEQWGLNLGFRQTLVDAKIDNPVNPTPQVDYKDKASYWLPSLQASLYFKPTQQSTLYATYDRTVSINQGGFGNGLTYAAGELGNQFSDKNFQSVSELFELGAKFEFIPERLFGTVSRFVQYRDAPPNRFGEVAQMKIEGTELSLRYQGEGHLSAGANYTWLKPYYTKIVPRSFSPAGWVADNQTVFGDSNALNQLPADRYRVSGVPEHSLNGFVDYRFDSGFGAQLSAWWSSHWDVRINNNITVPSEHNVNLALYYSEPRWDVRLQLLNITNQENFAPVIGEDAEFIQPLAPFTAQIQTALRF
ncbi:TonB-dependent receptor [Pseudomonas sp. 5P_3.1_Bac2]|uniref:TonB-dependent receptor n=1 Tax=Pseudomonas sp. 5P_3.1_Bac2 TaxID=2971617 RepID=UPI0021C890FC|nr:TonB-dependent receptor [Pseudomonas sp. 5P_3.1_Bac2]MCU1718190.1 TonB-dependent receptor plug domain-containing protein [Pseudomonas sp. 5P_3.1_Bac2]